MGVWEAVRYTYLISAIVNRSTSVQIMPRISFKFPSMMSGEKLGQFERVQRKQHTFRSNVRQFHTAGIDEFEGLVDILRLLNTHSWILIISAQGCVPW